MNEHAGYAIQRGGGWWAMLRLARDAKPKPILAEGGAPAVFPDELSATKAVLRHAFDYFNGDYRRCGAVIEATSRADALFPRLQTRARNRGRG